MYIVWTKEDFGDSWRRQEADTIEAVEAIIRDNFGKEVPIEVTVPVKYDARITVKIDAVTLAPASKPVRQEPQVEIKEEEQHAAEESRPAEDKGPGSKSNKPVRRGD